MALFHFWIAVKYYTVAWLLCSLKSDTGGEMMHELAG